MDNEHVKKSASPSPPEVRVLIPVWGERYIDNFIKFALPSLLAPGNLPVLAKACRVTVVFLTARKNFGHFQKRSQITKVLAGYCKIEYIPIDDLIEGTTSYSVPLTLAYFRGMMETGAAMTRTYFLCYNSDFILADGSLTPVLRHIQDGRSVILAPSFRVAMETVKPVLREHLLRAKGQLSMQPREMARLAFDHIHPTVISRVVNQSLFHSDYPNQIYWRVDENTLLARFYLIMQLCIKPERRVETINNFVDYAFLPEMCPSGDMVAMTDSDDFFMMELQAAEAENHFIRPGPAKVRHVAKSLSDWTTARHRDISKFELVFHTEELPGSLPSARDQLGRFMGEVEKRLVSQPVSHDRHHYWPGAIQAWLFRRQNSERNSMECPACSLPDRDVSAVPVEEVPADNLNENKQFFSGLRYQLFPQTLRYYFRIQRWKTLLLGIFWGLPPKVRVWHPQWFSFFLVKAWLRRQVPGKKERILYVTDETDFDGSFKESTSADKVLPWDLLGGFLGKAVKDRANYVACFIHLTEGNIGLAQRLVSCVHESFPETGRILLYAGQNLSQYSLKTVSYTNISMLVSYLNKNYHGQVRYRFLGGLVSGRIQRLLLESTEQQRSGWLHSFICASRILLLSAVMMVANAWMRLRSNEGAVPRGCAGMMVEIDFGNSSDTVKQPSHVS